MSRKAVTQKPPVAAGEEALTRPDIFSSPKAETAFLKMAARRGVRRDFYVVHHLPVDPFGKDFYAAYRARNPGFRCYIGYTMLETDRLPQDWPEALNGMDEIWVPSRFNIETFADSGVDPEKLFCIPLGFDPEPFLKPAKPFPITENQAFTFLSLFQWSVRKGPDLLVRAFLEAFDRNDPVCLAIRSFDLNHGSVRRRLHQTVVDLGYDPEKIPSIVLLDGFIPGSALPDLYRAADAFVLPSRGEGWGLPYLEAMAAGLPVIGTRWSGNTEFMHDDNSYLIDVEALVPVHGEAVQEMPYYKGHCYAEPSLEHLKSLMREVFENREAAAIKAKMARDEAHTLWTRQKTARAMTERFQAWHERWRRAARRRSPPALALLDSGKTDARTDAARNLDDRETFLKALNAEPDIVFVSDRAGCNDATAQLHHGDPTRFDRDPMADAHLARTAYPMNKLPASWVEALQSLDEVWLPSDFNIRSFSKSGIAWDKLVKIPTCVDADLYGPHLDKHLLVPDGGFVFLSVFPWTMRKGWDCLIDAFCRAFTPLDRVTLFLQILPDPAGSNKKVEQQLHEFISRRLRLDQEACPRIKLNIEPFCEMPLLYRAADAFVLPSRGERYGQELLKAMATGLPTITTGRGGALEFANDRNAWLLDFKQVPVPKEAVADNIERQGLEWAEPDREDLVRCLREIFEDRSSAKAKGLQAREEVAEKFSPERTARAVSERLALIQERKDGGSDFVTAKDQIRLILEGAFFTTSSTALVNRETSRALIRRDRVALAAKRLEADGADSDPEDNRFNALRERAGRPFSRPAQVYVWHQWPPSPAAPPSGHWVIWQGWEYGSLPEKIANLVRGGVDEIWTYSNHCAQEFIADGIPEKQISVISLGIDPDRFHPGAEVPDRFRNLTQKRTVFLYLGGTIWRKGIDILLSAFCQTFTRRDNVALVIKEIGSDSFYQGYNLTETIERLSQYPQAPEIVLIKDNLPDHEMPGLYNACTCLVHPYRGEGFGLPVLEAMACGLPVIVTQGGACDDFIPEGKFLPVPAKKREVSIPIRTVRPAWVLEPDKEVLSRQLRRVADDSGGIRDEARETSQGVRAKWTWDRTASAIEARCEALTGSLK